MTWDKSKIKNQDKITQHRSSNEAEPSLENEMPAALIGDEMATHELTQFILNEPIAPVAPSNYEREFYTAQGLIHPGDLALIRQQMCRGIYEQDGFAPTADQWPIDEPEEADDEEVLADDC